MAKVKMICPITKGLCIECAIYRGRHFCMCFSREYQGASLGAEQIEELKARYRVEHDHAKDEKFGMPEDIQKSSKWISNVEELVEVEELTERREP
ncbi:MAG TPA: hypothetical protein PKM08_00150 [Syntrophorhabdaceae bacterium]|nr:hypothetical protein [Syntrophorhabdaceae bacterium]HNT67982.1 hypothetical protein [Syntrophorhabdaceae bacterium]